MWRRPRLIAGSRRRFENLHGWRVVLIRKTAKHDGREEIEATTKRKEKRKGTTSKCDRDEVSHGSVDDLLHKKKKKIT